jgi:hypothetical protein
MKPDNKWGPFLGSQPYLIIKKIFILIQTIRKSPNWCSESYLVMSCASSTKNWSREYYYMQAKFLRRLTLALILFWFRHSNRWESSILQFGFIRTSSMYNRPQSPNWKLQHPSPVTHNFAKAFHDIFKLQRDRWPMPELIRHLTIPVASFSSPL